MGLNERPLMNVTGHDGVSVDLGEVLAELPRSASRATATAEAVVVPEAMQRRLLSASGAEQNPSRVAALPHGRACNAEAFHQPRCQARLLPFPDR
jgi:hypothetical protein